MAKYDLVGIDGNAFAEEEWKPIKNYEGIYEVSSYGRVRSIDRTESLIDKGVKCYRRRSGRIISQQISNAGYFICQLYHDGKCKIGLVHRLVAEAFLPNPQALPQVNHKDENKQNNFVENLEWCTSLYNVRYGTSIYRSSLARTNDPKRSKKVMATELKTGKVTIYQSTHDAERHGFNEGNVACCCRGVFGRKKNKNTYKGYKWEYIV